MPQTLLAILIGYLVGAIPTGVVVARAYGRVDLTRVGSRKTGATNVLRTLGKGPAAIVFLGDFLKGAFAMLLVRAFLTQDELAVALCGVAAVLGHAYSPFIGFKGGRGVTTGLGGLLVLSPLAAGAGALIGVAAIAASRFVSLGSILGTVTGAGALLLLIVTGSHPPAHAAFAVAVGAFIVVAHHDNIHRLLSGTERKLGQRVEQGG